MKFSQINTLKILSSRASQFAKLRLSSFKLKRKEEETVSPAVAERNRKIAVLSDTVGQEPNVIPHKVPLLTNSNISINVARVEKLIKLSLFQLGESFFKRANKPSINRIQLSCCSHGMLNSASKPFDKKDELNKTVVSMTTRLSASNAVCFRMTATNDTAVQASKSMLLKGSIML